MGSRLIALLFAALLVIEPVAAQVAMPALPGGAGGVAPPQWVVDLGSPRFALDFANNRYWGTTAYWGTGNSSGNRNSSAVTIQNSGAGTASAPVFYTPDTDGIWKPARGAAVPRITRYGLWIEGTNVCPAGGCITGGSGNARDNFNFALQGRNLANAAWTLSSMSASFGTTGADGTASATTLTATADGGKACQAVSVSPYNATKLTSGTGYTANDLLTVTTTGGTCSTAPVIRADTVTGGAVNTFRYTTIGSCSNQPANPVSVTGGSGSGATFDLVWPALSGSFLVKRLTGSGPISVSVDDSAYTAVTGSVNSSSFTQVGVKGQAAPDAPILCIKLASNGDQAVVDFGQLENNDSTYTSPIFVSATATLRGDELAYKGNLSNPNGGQFVIQNTYQQTPFCVYLAYSGNFSSTKSHLLFGTDAASTDIPIVTGAAGGGVLTVAGPGGTYTTTGTDVSGLYTLNKAVICFDAVGSKACVNGVGPTKSTSVKFQPAATAFTHEGFLNNGSNLLAGNGYAKVEAYHNRTLTDGECVQLSTVVNNN